MTTMRSHTPMMKQYFEIKSQHPEKLLFFRLGDFYELFFEDAVEAARELEITLTSRNHDSDGKPIPMCGMPHHSVQNYLSRLIKKGYKVAICEQIEDSHQRKGIVRREVTRIVTPGTTIEEGLLEAGRNNYLATLYGAGGRLGAAFLDVSTGEFWLSELSGGDTRRELEQVLTYFRPSELVFPEQSRPFGKEFFSSGLLTDLVKTPQADWTFREDYSRHLLLDHFQVASLEGFGLNGQSTAIAAAGALLYYVRQTQRTALSHITSLRYFEPARFLKLDQTTIRNLELVEGSNGNREWTLLSMLDRTKTGMGARLLRSWLLRPSLDVRGLEQRHDAVENLIESASGMGRLGQVFKSIYDIERLLGRVTLETANPRDLLALKSSFRTLPNLQRLLDNYRARLLRPKLDLLEDLVELLKTSIDPEAPVRTADGGVIRRGYDAGLDELRAISCSGKSFIAGLENREREATGIANLKVRYNKVFGYFIEVTKTHLAAVPERYLRKQTLVNCERFITPELKEYEEKVLSAEERILELERELFTQVRDRLASHASRIQQTAKTLALLDVLLCFAEKAHGSHYVRPQLEESTRLHVVAGRHPVLEHHSAEPFVPNDLRCDAAGDQLLILTGPNMGGKSTYLRQNALIVIMAQMGSFVPAEAATIGLVDQIYTRVGASDNLARAQSTFMVEMIETANILNTATPRSLVLLDEVGRGTATFDGLSLAWSIAEYLCTETSHKARTLFATHYQELTRLQELYQGVKNYRVSVRHSKGKILFFYRVQPGVASKSYGIEVARLAGVPGPVLERAREVLKRLERKELNLSGKSRSSSSHAVFEGLQKALF